MLYHTKDILNNCALPTFWQQFEGTLFSVPARLCPCMHNQLKTDELTSLVQRNLTEHFCDKLEGWFQARSSCPSSVNWPHKCSFGWMGSNFHGHTPKYCGKASQKSGGCYKHKQKETHVHGFGMGCPTGSYRHDDQVSTFGHIVYIRYLWGGGATWAATNPEKCAWKNSTGELALKKK